MGEEVQGDGKGYLERLEKELIRLARMGPRQIKERGIGGDDLKPANSRETPYRSGRPKTGGT